jgi:hypothetical protein
VAALRPPKATDVALRVVVVSTEGLEEWPDGPGEVHPAQVPEVGPLDELVLHTVNIHSSMC